VFKHPKEPLVTAVILLNYHCELESPRVSQLLLLDDIIKWIPDTTLSQPLCAGPSWPGIPAEDLW